MLRRTAALTAGVLVAVGPAGTAGAAVAGFGPSVPLSARDGALHREPAAALNERADALVAWVRAPARAPGDGVVRVAGRRGPRGVWSRARTLSPPGATAPRVALAPRGDGLVAFVRGGRLLAASRSGPAGRWTVRQVTAGLGPVRELAVALDPDGGRARLLWSEAGADGGSRVRLAVRPSAAEGWVAPVPALVVPGPGAPALALGPRRAGAAVAWTEGAGRSGRVRVATPVAPGWVATTVAEEPAAAPSAALSPRGDVLLAWATGLPGGSRVIAVRDRPAGRDLREPADVGLGAGPRVAVNARGDALVAWQVVDGRGRRGIEAVSRRRFAGRWTPSSVVAAGCACDLALGRPVVDARGGAVVTWFRDGGPGPGAGAVGVLAAGATRWRARALGPADTLTPPVAAVNARGVVLTAVAHSGGRAPIRVAGRDGGAPALRVRATVRPGARAVARVALPTAASVPLRLRRAGTLPVPLPHRATAGVAGVEIHARR